jgi:DNA (cytosine-5)-methyltransferase 1
MNKIIQIGNIVNTGNFNNPQRGRVYSAKGLSPALNTCSGGGLEPKIIDPTVCEERKDEGLRFFKDNVCGALRTKDSCGDKRVLEPTAAAMRGRQNGQQLEISDREYSNALTTVQKDSLVNCDFRIRKLTPKECWRLMGFTDEDFEKAKAAGISNSQLYKQAGNSIVVNCLEAIFKELLRGTEK